MKLEKIQEIKSVFPRKEYEYKMTFDEVTPSRMDVKEKVVATLSSNSDLTLVKNLKTEYRGKSATFKVRVYDDAESLKKLENKSMQTKNMPKKEESEDE